MKVISLLAVFLIFVSYSTLLNARAAEESQKKVLIAWGGVGRFGVGGYGYGRLLRLGVRGVNRGYRGGRGRFSHNHNRVNQMNSKNNQNSYYQGGSLQNNSLSGRAGSRFSNRHRNNELWNQTNVGRNYGRQSGNAWGQQTQYYGQ